MDLERLVRMMVDADLERLGRELSRAGQAGPRLAITA